MQALLRYSYLDMGLVQHFPPQRKERQEWLMKHSVQRHQYLLRLHHLYYLKMNSQLLR